MIYSILVKLVKNKQVVVQLKLSHGTHKLMQLSLMFYDVGYSVVQSMAVELPYFGSSCSLGNHDVIVLDCPACDTLGGILQAVSLCVAPKWRKHAVVAVGTEISLVVPGHIASCLHQSRLKTIQQISDSEKMEEVYISSIR